MKKIFLIMIVFVLYCCNLKGQDLSNTTFKKTMNLFQTVENKMQTHYNYLGKNRIFEDPLGRITYFFKIVNKNAPELLCRTTYFKDDLLNILLDRTLEKNIYTNLDIIYLLYNIEINDYVDILEQVCEMYEQDMIDYKIFDSFIFQDFNVSNSIAKNYQNEKLKNFFDKLLKNKCLINKCQSSNELFKNAIIGLQNGYAWNGKEDSSGLKKINEIQPPILDTLKIVCP